MSGVIFIYQASLYCEDCGEKIRAKLRAEGKAPENEADEYSYDSGDFPKVALLSQSEMDNPNHCDGCSEYLPEPLTSDGVCFVVDALQEYIVRRVGSSEVLDAWYEEVRNYSPEESTDGTSASAILSLYAQIRDYERKTGREVVVFGD